MPKLQIKKQNLVSTNLKEVVLPVVGGYYRSYYICVYGASGVDGRTSSEVIKHGLPAVYGGDLAGFLAVFEYVYTYYNEIFEALFSPQGVVKDFIKFIENLYKEADLKFYLHTDEHAIHEKNGIGCGHYNINVEQYIKNASAEQLADLAQEFYFTLLEQSQNILDINVPESDAIFVKEVLQGDHKEQAVIVIDSSDYTLPRSLPQFRNVFVYNEPYAKELVDFQAHVVWHYFDQKGTSNAIESLNEWQNNIDNMYKKQVERTNKALVEPKNLPIYEVEVVADNSLY